MNSGREELVIGADHADKIGKIVFVDVELETFRTENALVERVIWTGVLHSARDEYENSDLVRTLLRVGNDEVTINWDTVDGATIEVYNGT